MDQQKPPQARETRNDHIFEKSYNIPISKTQLTTITMFFVTFILWLFGVGDSKEALASMISIAVIWLLFYIFIDLMHVFHSRNMPTEE